MSSLNYWTGKVLANSKEGSPTEIMLNKGDVISVVATGWADYSGNIPNGGNPNPNQYLSSPQGVLPIVPPSNPKQFFLAAKIGNNIYEIGNGVLHKEIPEDGGGIKVYLFICN
ncbi:lectin [Xenorhabdus budapestensis]|uniref:Lectin n=1 Tax=Xenorhabdus budapestensis TaxID=290110 RepID=A0ABX7VEI0_XENBU|nr:LecA/PA-IL family lectin [Xenorhabdus budapestensis]QTL39201.1 lectin [Xenorhabdus budapestensis]